MLSTTVSMWLGIAFTFLCVLAVILQAWLWSFPMEPDPGGPDPHGKSTAPRLWTNVHRVAGLMYVIIYVILMIEMVPRLWEYQIELPARTIMHACMGITIGILLITKISIIRWFQHFGQALPSIGLGLLTCTMILATLSIPYAIRAHNLWADSDFDSPENLARVEKHLKTLELGDNVDVQQLVTKRSLKAGRDVLVNKCKLCHDMRTILRKPKKPKQWFKTVKRMARMPSLGNRILDHEIPKVTAWLIAITPAMVDAKKAKSKAKVKAKAKTQKSEPAAAHTPTKTKTDASKTQKTTVETKPKDGETKPKDGETKTKVAAATDKAVDETTETVVESDPKTTDAAPAAKPSAGDMTAKGPPKRVTVDAKTLSAYKAIYEEECSSCHELSDVDDHGKQDRKEWTRVVRNMVDEQDAELDEETQSKIIDYLVATRGK